MSRYLVTCWPYVGHVIPQLGIAAALRERGHEVAFYTGEEAGEAVSGAGFERMPFERVDERRIAAVVERLERGAGAGRPRIGDVQRCFRAWLVESIPDQLADLDGVIARWRPDVIICDLSMWAPIVILGERAAIPVALCSTFLGPPAPAADVPPPGLGLPSPKGPVRWAAARAVSAVSDVVARGLRGRVDELSPRARGSAPTASFSSASRPSISGQSGSLRRSGAQA
jgi:CheY-like chemotaxis protein